MFDLHEDKHLNYTTAQLRESGENGCDVCADWYDEATYEQSDPYAIIGTPQTEIDHLYDVTRAAY